MPHPLASPAGRNVPARDLEEVKFWLEIMREHALFIKNGLPVTSPDLVSEADDFYRRFGELITKANKVNGEKKYSEIINDALGLVRKFYRFNRRLLRLALTGKLGGSLFPLMLDHMSREALYVILLLDRLCKGKQAYYQASMLREMLFWLRLMADHVKLIRHLLDPSETGLIETAEDFAAEFDALYLQARDLASMLGVQGDVPAFDRFILDVRAAVVRLRDFKRALYAMIQEGRVIGLIPAPLADHMREEADHFLMVLAMMEKGMIGCTGQTEQLEIMDEELLAEEAAGAEDVVHYDLQPACSPEACVADEEMEPAVAEVLPIDEDELDDDERDPAPPQPPPAPAPTPAPNPKFKWSGKWPRPLGKKPE